MTAREANDCIIDVIQAKFRITSVPLSDGGEGFVSLFSSIFRDEGKEFTIAVEKVTGPIGNPVDAEFIVYEEKGTKFAVFLFSFFLSIKR